MQSVSMCSQYDPRLGKTIPCGGNVHELIIKTSDGSLDPTDIQVCDDHMQSFKKLGQREIFKFTIEGDRIIGIITSTSLEGQRPAKEKK